VNCPRCNVGLELEKYKGIEVDRCPNCRGMWLDYHELGQLEDIAFDSDGLKGTMVYSPRTSELLCPRCRQPMKAFEYRAYYDLELDFCPEEHGFWLDAGEEKRVLELMWQAGKDLKRKAAAEAEWRSFLRKAGSKSLFDRIKGLFQGY
jgi:Zn-finger nucleic acid-binding protein